LRTQDRVQVAGRRHSVSRLPVPIHLLQLLLAACVTCENTTRTLPGSSSCYQLTLPGWQPLFIIIMSPSSSCYQLSHSINAIDPAPHRSGRKREHCSRMFASITHIPSLIMSPIIGLASHGINASRQCRCMLGAVHIHMHTALARDIAYDSDPASIDVKYTAHCPSPPCGTQVTTSHTVCVSDAATSALCCHLCLKNQ
jgi:hypothetical protein